jgi:hypothetical protein
MAKKIVRLAVVIGVSLQFFLVLGCASTLPMTTQTVSKFGLANNQEGFKAFKYYLSRDITLKHVSASGTAGVVGGQGVSSSTIERNIIEFLASTRGEVVNARTYQGDIILDVAFEASDDNFLSFRQNKDGYFYLAYTNPANMEILYEGVIYKVTWGQDPSSGNAGAAAFFGVSTTQNDDPYANMPPLLLYKETSVTVEKEKRRTATGR